MALTGYNELLSELLGWTDDIGLSGDTATFVTLAEGTIYRKMRIGAMEDDFSVVLSGGEAALPADFIEMKHLRIVSSGATNNLLEPIDANELYRQFPKRTSDGKPVVFARDQTKLIFGPFPDSNYTVKGTYYKRLAALSTTNTTNWFMANAPDLLLAASMVEASLFLIEDERSPAWKQKMNQIMQDIYEEENQARASGGPKRSIAR